MSKILLSASHIVQYFGDQKILEFEKLNIYEGDHIGIVGANGAGKTTLLNLLSGELTPDEGTVMREVPINYFKQFRGQVEQADPQKCRELGLSGKLSRKQLSGGERTRLSLAAMNPDFLLTFADEPTALCIYTQKGNKKIRKPQAANQTALIFDRRAAARLLSINSIRRLCWS